ncbi:MAG: class I SAM-dependent methyltransferase, partial [Stellaceae bacterium]
MDDIEFKLIEAVQDRHWWWIGRRRIIERLIRKFCAGSRRLHIADVGSGFGANIPLLKQFGDVTALEPSAEAVAKLNRIWSGDSDVRALQWTSPEPVAERFDLILLADVLEHIADDDAAVDWIWRHLTPGGHAILTVPAHIHLWTEMDEVVHHHRRYNRDSLSRLFERRFSLRRLSYYNL